MPSTSEVSLESTFSDLALARLRDRAAPLMDYLLGFQLLKANEDGSKAVGIFGFEVDDALYYGPAFFMNGEIKGLDSIYSVESDLFVPLEEDWLNELTKKHAPSLGETDTRDRNARGVRVPNYTRLNQVPGGLNKISQAMLGLRTCETISLPEGLSILGKTADFKAACERHPRLLETVQKYYDLIDFVEVKQASVKQAAEQTLVLISSTAHEGVDKLTDAQRDDILAGGVAVIDKRPGTERSILYRTETKQVFTTPTQGGLYDVIMQDGSVQPILVGAVHGTPGNLFLYTEDKRNGFVCRDAVHTLRQYENGEFRKQLEKLGTDLADVRANDCVVFMSVDGEAIGTYTIENVVAGLDGHKTFRVRGSYGPTAWREHPLSSRGAPWTYDSPECRITEVLVTEKGGGTARLYKNRLVIGSKHFRAIVTSRSGEYSFDSSERICAADLGGPDTVLAHLEKVAAPLKVWVDHSEVAVRDQFGTHQFGKVAALSYLLRQHKLGEEDAKLILKEASVSPNQYRVKYAAEFLDMPQIDDTSDGGGYMTAFTPEQVPVGVEQRAQSPNNYDFYRYTSPFAGGSDIADEQTSVDVLNQAAQTGQREVFDAAGLASLVKANNPTELVDKFIPTIVAGMDRLGRLLFLVHWHYEEFEERYGEQELGEFIDQLRNTYKHLGETVLFLKKRSLSDNKDFFGLGLAQASTN